MLIIQFIFLILRFISKLIETKNHPKCLIGYLDDAMRPLVLILSKFSVFLKTFKNGYKDINKNNGLMYLRINDDKLQEKYETIWAQIENLQNIELNALLVYDDRYTKTKTRAYDDKVYTNCHGLNVPEDNVECESVLLILYLFIRANIVSKYI